MDVARVRSKPHHATQNGCARQALLTRLQNDPFIERLVLIFIRFADENAKQCPILWKLHGLPSSGMRELAPAAPASWRTPKLFPNPISDGASQPHKRETQDHICANICQRIERFTVTDQVYRIIAKRGKSCKTA